MARRPIRTWCLLAVVVAFVAVGAAAGSGGTASHLSGDVAGITNRTSSGGVLEAVLRTQADRVETILSSKSAAAARLLLLLAATLAGLAVLPGLAFARRGTRLVESAAQGARLRAWLSLRAPPSPLLVSVPR